MRVAISPINPTVGDPVGDLAMMRLRSRAFGQARRMPIAALHGEGIQPRGTHDSI